MDKETQVVYEQREKNEKKRKTAPIPEGKKDLTGLWFTNKHNSVFMQIVSHWVSDKGIVIWTSNTGDVYGSLEMSNHWEEYQAPVKRFPQKTVRR